MTITKSTTNLFAVIALALAVGCQKPLPSSSTPSDSEKSAPAEPSMPAPSTPTPSPSAPPAPIARPVIDRQLPESKLVAPLRDSASKNIEYGTILSTRTTDAITRIGWQYRRTRQQEIVGFEFSNHGGNRILPPKRDAARNQFFTRDFQFRFDDQARQDIHLMVSDWVPSGDKVFRLSELMNSLMHFFPRTLLPAIANIGERNLVTLPTGEEVEFHAATHEIVGGVFSEAPVDLNPDRNGRGFPRLGYQGKGVLIRADARGSDPRIGTTATIRTGTPPANCEAGTSCATCQVPSRELWDQSGAVRFKFATDHELDKFLTAKCGFGLPRNGGDFVLAAPAK